VTSISKFCSGGSICIPLFLNLLNFFQSHSNRVVGMVCMRLPSISNRSMFVLWVCMVSLLVVMFLSGLHSLIISLMCRRYRRGCI
jgi:hypothetical protein